MAEGASKLYKLFSAAPHNAWQSKNLAKSSQSTGTKKRALRKSPIRHQSSPLNHPQGSTQDKQSVTVQVLEGEPALFVVSTGA